MYRKAHGERSTPSARLHSEIKYKTGQQGAATVTAGNYLWTNVNNVENGGRERFTVQQSGERISASREPVLRFSLFILVQVDGQHPCVLRIVVALSAEVVSQR